MAHDSSIEEQLEAHIAKHDSEYTTLLRWIIGTLITLIASGSGIFISIGHDQERLDQLERAQQNFVTQTELQGAIALFNNKIDNLTEKIDRLLLRP